MEAQTTTKLSCLQLNPSVSLQQLTSSSANLSVWQRLEWIDTSVDLEIVTIFLGREDKGLSISEAKEKVLPKSTGGCSIFNDDIFRYQKVNVGNCRQWSRHLLAESRRPATVSAAPISSERKTNPPGPSDITIQLPKLDLGELEKKKEEDEKIEGQKDRQNKMAEMTAQEMCKQLPKKDYPQQAGHLEELESLHKKWQKTAHSEKPEDFEDLTVLTGDTIEVGGVKQKDKSIRRRFLNWLDGIIHDHYRKKVEETYRREREEGDQFYPTNFYFAYPMTRAQRERQKRATWLRRDKHRQAIKGHLDAFWEEKRKNKEALKVKEEERFERWALKHNISISNSPPDKPKSRMSIWEKRCLRAKEFFFC